jgi:hypothetical protein
MESPPFIKRLRALHAMAQARRPFDTADQDTYDEGRRMVLQVAVVAQNAMSGAHSRRKHIRVGLELDVALTFAGAPLREVKTVDIGTQGFSALLADRPAVGASAKFAMKVAGGMEPVVGTCLVVGMHSDNDGTRVSFSYDHLDASARVRLEITLFDYLLRSLP